MKKLTAVLPIIIICLLLCACSQNSSQLEQKTSESEFTGERCDNNGIDELFEHIDKADGSVLLSGDRFAKENCYNITPAEIGKIGGTIYKFSDSCASFLLYEDKVYQLGEYFGGYGFINAVTCDFDNDGKEDILYSYSYGSGMHRSVIFVFNTTTKTDTIVFDSLDGQYSEIPTDIDLFVSKQTPNAITDNPPVYYVVYSARINVLDNNFAKLQYLVTNTIGNITSEKKMPVFTPTSRMK